MILKNLATVMKYTHRTGRIGNIISGCIRDAICSASSGDETATQNFISVYEGIRITFNEMQEDLCISASTTEILKSICEDLLKYKM